MPGLKAPALIALTLVSITATAQDRPPTLVVTEPVQSMEFHDQVTLTGRTEAWVTSRIVSEVAGRVAEVNAEEGVLIEKGQPLVTIDAEQLQYVYDAKAAETEQARERSELAADQFERAEDLYQRDLVPETTLDSARTWKNITEQEYRQLDADRRRLQLDLRNCRIAAPFSGYTGRKLVDVGEWVSPGTPVFEMVDVSHIRVRVDLPERYFGRLSKGSDVTVRLSEGQGEPVTGTVIGISPNAGRETHTFPVIVDVPNPSGRLAGGMLVRAVLSLDDRFNSLAVSKDAIIRQGPQTLVYTVREGKAAPVPVVTTSTDGKMIAVRGEQLSEGMPVVVRGNERIFPGAPVNIAGGQPAAEQASAASTGQDNR